MQFDYKFIIFDTREARRELLHQQRSDE
jgi:hypothetical protein